MLVRLKQKTEHRRPNPEGEIVEVIERETHQFVGTYFELGGVAYVQVDGMPFSQPMLLGDPGAKQAQTDDKVVIEMVRFPTHAHEGEGVITEVLGRRGEPGVDTLSIIREFNLPDEFAEDAVEESRHRGRQVRRIDRPPAYRLDRCGDDHDRSGRRPRLRRRGVART